MQLLGIVRKNPNNERPRLNEIRDSKAQGLDKFPTFFIRPNKNEVTKIVELSLISIFINPE